MWNFRLIGKEIPDHIAFSIGLNSTFVRGQSISWSLNLLTRGKEPGLSVTVTKMDRIMGEIDWGVNLTMSEYNGNPLDLDKASLTGRVESISANYIYGGEFYRGFDPYGKIVWGGVSTGFGFSYGMSYGTGVTTQIWP